MLWHRFGIHEVSEKPKPSKLKCKNISQHVSVQIQGFLFLKMPALDFRVETEVKQKTKLIVTTGKKRKSHLNEGNL